VHGALDEKRPASWSASNARTASPSPRAATCCSPSAPRADTHDLGLDKAGVDIDAAGYIVVDDQCRTSAEG